MLIHKDYVNIKFYIGFIRIVDGRVPSPTIDLRYVFEDLLYH